MKTRIIIIILSLLFTLMSFLPSIYESLEKDKIIPERYFVLEHNYNFDYNFYLSRIREGIEGKWLITEKYFNQPHKSSLFQAVYLYLGRVGGLFGMSVPAIYHTGRFIFGFLLLLSIAGFGRLFFKEKQLILFFLLAVTTGSWPILVRVGPDWIGVGSFWRFATYMGWWSVIDSLQRITIMPHILIGQILLVMIIRQLNDFSRLKAVKWGIAGLIAGIIFPPTIVIVYAYLFLLSVFELVEFRNLRIFVLRSILPKLIFFAVSVPSLIYAQISFGFQPWKALMVFDIEHRFIMPYKEYALALGPVLILGILGLFFAFFYGKKIYNPAITWVLSIVMLFLVFENVPQQSPLRFTEGLIHVPLVVLATYFLSGILKNKLFKKLVAGSVVFMGLMVMISMVFWLTDQVKAKRESTWPVPLGAQLAYPINDFMEGIFYLKENTNVNEVVLTYITAGNYIPAYAGNYVYIGHANTPDEDEKEVIASTFFKGEMTVEEAKKWLKQERISYIFFGPQERDLGGVADLKIKYDFLTPVYSNKKVVIYKIT